MNLIEKLIRTDKDKAYKREEKKIKSARLSRILGEDTEITIRELSGRKINDLSVMAVDKKGNIDQSKLLNVNLMYCVEGIVEPNLKDAALMEHFGAKTPKDLAEILFDVEANKIADKIAGLSGITEDAEDEVKNS